MTINDHAVPADRRNCSADSSFLSVSGGYILATTAALTPCVVFLADKALVPIAIVTAFSVLGVQLARRDNFNWKLSFAEKMTIAIIAWALLSTCWADETVQALLSTMKLTGNSLLIFTLSRLALNLKERERVLLKYGLLAGFISLVIVVTTEIVTNGMLGIQLFGAQLGAAGLFWANSSALALAILLWPVGIVLLYARHLTVFLLLSIGLFVATTQMKYGTGSLIVVVGMMAAALSWSWPRFGPRFLALMAAAHVLLMPLGVAIKPPATELAKQDWLSNSAIHRLHIWDFATKKVAEHPIVGWGMNMARSIPGGHDRAEDQRGFHGELMPLHPHNAPLQIWLELGSIGALIGAIFLFSHFWRIARFGSDRRIIAIVTGQSITVLVAISISFGIWQGWLLALVGLTSAWTLAMIDHTSTVPAAQRR